jgi:hypothetical protein
MFLGFPFFRHSILCKSQSEESESPGVCAVGILIEGTNAERHEDGENCYGWREKIESCALEMENFLTEGKVKDQPRIFFKF